MSFKLNQYKTLQLHFSENVLMIKLNRPDTLNAFNLEMVSELVDCLEKYEEQDEVHVIVITGAGKAFSAGGDIMAMHEKSDMFAGDIDELRTLYQRGIQKIPLTIEKMQTPLIAIVNGAAVGAGCDLACMCDLRIMSSEAFFKESFINLALVSGDGGSYYLNRIIGYGRAMDMLLTGRKIKAGEALEIGLVNYVFSHTDLEEEAMKIAKSIASHGSVASRMNKAGLKNASRSELYHHLEFMACLQAITQRSSEHEKLVQKFVHRSKK
ncbi:MAG: enoyl-CoA hydratase/isomerase family protein [Halobacteriovoraceae bacterium]|nr:enoyl-CoA hydratase/isomerase family protein [Halobacteriovoraceae bacterium]MCB9093849.1 enoyl-CoA hydratase/isomerase family protein [Halobacteriovoraceae bacterium]